MEAITILALPPTVVVTTLSQQQGSPDTPPAPTVVVPQLGNAGVLWGTGSAIHVIFLSACLRNKIIALPLTVVVTTAR